MTSAHSEWLNFRRNASEVLTNRESDEISSGE